jgi:hypothetical protein
MWNTHTVQSTGSSYAEVRGKPLKVFLATSKMLKGMVNVVQKAQEWLLRSAN